MFNNVESLSVDMSANLSIIRIHSILKKCNSIANSLAKELLTVLTYQGAHYELTNIFLSFEIYNVN